MKKFLTGILAILTVFACATGCDFLPNKNSGDSSGNEVVVPDESELQIAADYLDSLYKEKDVESNKDYEVLSSIMDFPITWTVDVTSGVTVVVGDDGKVTIDIDDSLTADLTYVLTATITDGTETKSVSFTRKALPVPNLVPEAIEAAPVTDTAYKLYVYQKTKEVDLYFAGRMADGNSSYYFATTENYDEAADIYVEYKAGSTTEFYPYFIDEDDTKQYIGVRLSSDGEHDNIVFDPAHVSVFVWNETLKTITTHLDVNKDGVAADYYLGNYNTLTTISASKTSYAATSNVGGLVKMVNKNSIVITDADKVAAIKDLVDVQLEHKVDKTITLPTSNAKYEDVTIAWSVPADSTCASIATNNDGEVILTLTIPETATTVTLTATLTCGTTTDTKTFNLTLGPKVVAPAADASAADIVNAAYALAKNEKLGEYTLTGVIKEVNTAYSADFKNVTVTITVAEKDIECYRLKGTGADTIAVGDTITVKGTLKNYNGKVEFDSGCTIVTDDEPTTPTLTTPEEILNALYNLADGEELSGSFTLTGKITALDSHSNPTIVVEGFEDKPVYCYYLRVTNAVNDVITVKATKMKNYDGTYEFMDCELVTEDVGGGDPVVTPTTVTTIPEALTAAVDTNVVVTGTVVSIRDAYNSEHNNISVWLADENGVQILAYRLTGNVEVGKIIKVTGVIDTYGGAKQIAQGCTFEEVGTHSCSKYTDATCKDPAKCVVCGTAKDNILSTVHNYVNGICSVCNATDPDSDVVAPTTATLSFASANNRIESSTTQQIWKQNDITLTYSKGNYKNDLAEYANPVRFYAGTEISITAPGSITKLIFDCNSTSYATTLNTSIGTVEGATVTISNDKVTVVFATAVDSFSVTMSAQVRMDSLEVSYIAPATNE